MNNKTVQNYISKLEEIITLGVNSELEYIGGPGIEVQRDEPKFGKGSIMKIIKLMACGFLEL